MGSGWGTADRSRAAGKSYLVTGGLGFLGAALTRALVAAGHTVRVFDNSSRGSVARLGDAAGSVEILDGDIRDAAAVEGALAGVDCVCHLAFINGTRHFYERPAEVLEVGVKGMLNVLDGCIRQDVGELILASSSEVYQTPPSVPTDETVPLSVPDPLNPRYSYGGGKIISELLALNYGRERLRRVVVFRPHNVYGPDMGWEHVIPEFIVRLSRLAARTHTRPLQFPIQGSGAQSRSFIYIGDFIRGLLRVVEQGEHLNIYHVGTTEEVSIRSLAERVARSMGYEIDVVPGAPAQGGTDRRCPDITKLRALGFVPTVPLEEGLRPTVDWYVAHEHLAPDV